MNPRVTDVRPLPDHGLLVTFTDGQQRSLDVRPYLTYAVFSSLRDSACFDQVKAEHGTVSWPGGIDLDPDSVFLDSVPVVLAHAV